MKVGTVLDRGRLFPTGKLEIETRNDGVVPVVAIIDTGFTEWLTLPSDMIKQLGLRRAGRTRLIFGNSTDEMVNVYEARVRWCETWMNIRVHQVSDIPMIGMQLLRGHRIEFDALRDAEIDVEPVIPMMS